MGVIGSFQGYVDSPLYLFDKGVWSNLQTTGMTATNGSCIVQYVGETIRLINYIAARLKQKVNLSNYNYLHITLPYTSNTDSGYVGVSTDPNLLSKDSLIARVSFNSPLTEITVTVPISNIIGEYYIYIFGRGFYGDYLEIRQLYLTTV